MASAAASAQQAQQVQSQINVIADSISKINDSISATAGQISDTQAIIDGLSEQIKRAEEDIAAQKVKMGQIIAAWYMQGDSGLLESLLGSDSVSQVIDVQEQYDSVKQQVNANIDRIAAEELALSTQKSDQLAKKQQLSDLQAQQKSSKAAVVSQSQQKNSLLSMTLAQQQNYLNQVTAAKKEIEDISAEDAAWRIQQARNNGSTTRTGGATNYMYANSTACTGSSCPMDQWLFGVRQCTSYVAWYWYDQGYDWYNTQPGSGSAKYWADMVPANNAKYNRHYYVDGTPERKAIISWRAVYTSHGLDSTYGHVAIVEKVNANGTIDISQYNYAVPVGYDYTSNVNPSNIGTGYSYIHPGS